MKKSLNFSREREREGEKTLKLPSGILKTLRKESGVG